MAWIIGIIVVAAIGGGVWWRWFDTYHLATVDPGKLYRDGNRSLRVFIAALRQQKVKTVVCLVDDREIAQPPFPDEVAYCQNNGVELVRLPIRLGGWPTTEQVREFLAVATDSARQPVLVHCAQGVRRTGMMVAAYQESVLHLDKETAKARMLTFGHSERTIRDVKRFIDIYEPQSQAVTVELEMSKE